MSKYLILFALILIQSCSSGGGDSTTPTDPDTVFNSFPPEFFTSYNKTFNFTGSSNLGDTLTATFSQQTMSETVFLSTPAIPILTQQQVTNTKTGAIANAVGNAYYSTSASDRRYLGHDGDTVTVSATTSPIPETAKIGDIGVIGTYTQNDGSVTTQSWRLDDGSNGRGELVLLFTHKDQFDNLEYNETQKYLIDTSGNVLTMSVVLSYADGTIITFSGS